MNIEDLDRGGLDAISSLRRACVREMQQKLNEAKRRNNGNPAVSLENRTKAHNATLLVLFYVEDRLILWEESISRRKIEQHFAGIAEF